VLEQHVPIASLSYLVAEGMWCNNVIMMLIWTAQHVINFITLKAHSSMHWNSRVTFP
jgi:hypothetical protein